jgi:hypothetical protein
MTQPEHDPISEVDHQILALFREQLAELRFPDLDTTQLEVAADVVYAAQVEVEALELALSEARMRVLSSVQSLHVLAERGLAYAGVYATGKPEIETRVSQIRQLAMTPERSNIAEHTRAREAENKKRGRPRKEAHASLLPMTESPMTGSSPMTESPSSQGDVAAETTAHAAE